MDKLDQKVSMDIFKNMSAESVAPLDMVSEEYDNSAKRPKTTSKVWDFFEKLPAQHGNSKAICKICRRIYTAKTTSGTSHLRRHVETCLKRGNHDVGQHTLEPSFGHVNRDIVQQTASQETLTDVTTPTQKSEVDVDEIRRAIATMIVVDEQPFSLVENLGFRRVMAVACPEYDMMSSQTMKREVISLYVKEKENIRELIATCPGRICLSSSTWKSNMDDYYHCVSAHFIDHNWRLQKRILRFKLIPPPYDSLFLGDEVASCMVQWNIEHKVFSITLENLSSDDCIATMLKSRLDTKKYLPCKGVFFHVNCCAHLLNFIVQTALNLIDDIIGKLRLSIKYVKQSPHRKKNFYIIAKTLNLDTQKRLCLDFPMRWNSMYEMLEVARRYKNAFVYFSEQDKNFREKLMDDEWEKVGTVCKFLKVFHEVTSISSGSRILTSNLYFKGIWKVHARLLDMLRGPENFMTSMVKEIEPKFSQYWSECSLILACAAILDPRYKVKFVEYCYTKLYGSDAQQYVGTIVSTLYGLFDEYMQASASPSCSSGLSVVATKVTNDREDNEEFEDYETFQSARFRTQVEKSQLDLYLEEPNNDLNSEIDVLEYWSICSPRYPELSKMARDVLTIPMSTIASESAFGIGPQVISPHLGLLKPKTVQAVICLQDWMRTYDRTSSSAYYESNDGFSSSNDDDDY